jgi:predicted AAA+ superfamily ATPase
MFLEFTDRRGKTRVLKSPASFPRMMEIMYNIADLAPQARLNDELDKMVGVIRRMKEKQSEVEQ